MKKKKKKYQKKNQILVDLKKIKKLTIKKNIQRKRSIILLIYIFDKEIFKSTCKNKYNKSKLSFYCSDIHCKAKGIYFLDSEIFEPENEPNIVQEDHFYVISDLIKAKQKKADFYKKDFQMNKETSK